jgi:3D (Asp-Asp-Asp) domain-containing protein
MMKCVISRVDGVATEYGSEVYVDYIDCHYQKDTMGSRQQTVK